MTHILIFAAKTLNPLSSERERMSATVKLQNRYTDVGDLV